MGMGDEGHRCDVKVHHELPARSGKPGSFKLKVGHANSEEPPSEVICSVPQASFKVGRCAFVMDAQTADHNSRYMVLELYSALCS